MKLVFIHGAPAVGKLTVARELARLCGLPLFHNHLTVDLVSSIFPFGSEPFVRLREEIWLATFRQAARDNTSLIFTFAPERTVRPHFIDDTNNVVESSGGKIIFVELTCAEPVLQERLVNPTRSEFGKLNSIEQYRELKDEGAFQFPRIASTLSLDTTNTDPEVTAQLIADHLGAGMEV